ncbi:MAG: hypothetical protein ABIS92_01325 [Polyangia bacterium]
MLDPLNPAKWLLLVWLVAAASMTASQITRRFLGAREPLDRIGYTAAFSLLIVGTVGSWMGRLVRQFPVTFIFLAVLLSVPLVPEVLRWFRRTPAARSGLDQASFPWAATVLDRRERTIAIAMGILILFPPLWAVWRTHLWDDWYFYMPLTSAFSRGILPVVYPFLPDRAVTYHYSFAWLAGILEYHTGVSPEICVDIISTVFLVTFYLSAAATFRLWVGGRLAPYLGAALAIGFGPLAWLWALVRNDHQDPRSWWSSWFIQSSQTTFSDAIARPMDYLLQKPMLAGMALVWLVMALVLVSRRRISVAGAALAGLCVGMVELFQYPVALLAGLAGLAVLALDVLIDGGNRKQRLQMLVAFGLFAVALPPLNGGFVANPQGDAIVMERIWSFPFPPTVAFGAAHKLSTFLCYTLYYGAPLLVFPLVLPSFWRQRSFTALWMLVFGGAAFAIPHVLHHKASPVNITKFFHLSDFALAALVAAGLLLTTRRWSARLRMTVLTGFVILASLSTWTAAFNISIPRNNGVMDPATVQSMRLMARWLRQHAGTYDRMFALTDEVEAMSGVLSPLPPFAPGGRQLYTVTAHGYAPPYIDSMRRLTESAAASLDDDSLLRLKIRWVVLPDPLPDVVGPEARRRLADPQIFKLRQRTVPTPAAGWFVYEYLKGPPPNSLER